MGVNKGKYQEWEKEYPYFKPDYTPCEMFREGIFGGNYFKPEIPKRWSTHVPDEFIDEFKEYEIDNLLRNSNFIIQISKWRVDCGSTYEDWNDNGWIHDQDPYGWVNWYINFYYGRRSDDDSWQLNRWGSFKGRHSATLKKTGDPKDITHGFKTRQNMLHWAIDSMKID
jgi:hypothetical protein